MQSEKIKQIAQSRELIFIFDARDCNPNGERNDFNGDGPRIDPKTGKALITDLRLKRCVRDYLNDYSKEDSDHIMIQRTVPLDNKGEIHMKNVFMNDLGLTDESSLKKMKENDIMQMIQNAFIDHRLFGSLLHIKKNLHATTGPVQFEITKSLNAPQIVPITITSAFSSGEGKKSGTFGSFKIIDYAIFATHGIVKHSLAKFSGATERDIQKLFDGLWNGVKSVNTRSKIGLNPRLLISIKMKDPDQQISGLTNIFDNSLISKGKSSDIYDKTLDLTDFGEKLTKYSEKIESVEYREDYRLKYSINQHNIDSIENLVEELNLPFVFEKM